MTLGQLTISGPIVLICSKKFLSGIENQLTPFMQELDQLARNGTLPVTLEAPSRKDWRMAVHTSRYVASLYPTQAGDAYNAGYGGKRQFRDDDRLVKGALLLRCHYGFRAFLDLRSYNDAIKMRAVPRGATYADALWQAWRNLPSMAGKADATPRAHGRYLDLLDIVVEASRQIETDRQSAVPPQHYVSREAAKEQRHSARGVYRFRMARRGELTTNTMVCLGDTPEARGRVIRVDGKDVTVRFEPGTDFGQIRNQGTLKVLPSERVYRAQRETIAQLRKGESLNPKLLDNLVSADFLAYRPASDAVPKRELDPDQLNAFRRAATVPDVLSVLGPPGAGKTTTIVEVIQACVAQGQRVLITSHTHRAVDNVLEGLPPDLNVVRIGNEDNMSSRVKSLSSESRVEAVRKEILADSGLFDRLSEMQRQRPLLERYSAHLVSKVDQIRSAQEKLDRLGPAISEAVKRASGALRQQLEDAERALRQHRSVVATHEAALARAQDRLKAAQAKIDSGSVLAFVYRWLARRHRGRIDNRSQALPPARAALSSAETTFAELWARAESMAAHDPHFVKLKIDRDTAHTVVTESWPEVRRVGVLLMQAIRPLMAVPPVPESDVAAWVRFHQWCGATLAALERRAALLGEWRGRINDLGAELEREIARYADVVGATCIGTDTSALISKLEFDLAIVDEAGQISTPNLLVPLVRSRRAMLVGDHKQLPPFLDEEVRKWAKGLTASDDLTPEELPRVTELLAKSGFELLFPLAKEANAVWLKTQRRMPAQIAEFVSQTFYFGRLDTAHPGSTQVGLFTSPFAMVDTSDQPQAQRRETAMRGRGEAIQHGYRNELEAEIIADLLVNHERLYQDWAVIVPFNAQKELIIERLSAVMSPSSRVADNVGSVDSFQGGERDLIIFGFTRSNRQGDIGFLREIRRFNVAITRAKRQLVLVGDLSTLRVAKDHDFRNIMHSMTDHLARHGDRRASLEVKAALSSMTGRAS